MTSAFIGIDLGTSSVKAVVVDEKGAILSTGSAEYPISHPQPGWAEQDPDEWWGGVVSAVRQAIGWLPTGTQISGIGLAGQMHGTVLLGDTLTPIAPAIIWADGRSWRQVPEITNAIGRERLADLAGSPLAVGFQAATIAWLQKEQASTWWRTAKVISPKDEIRRRLTGEIATDPGDASAALLLDVRWRAWAADILKVVDIDLAKLPEIVPASAVAGGLTPTAAEELGLPAGTPVVTGTGDAGASLLGAGIVDPSTMLLSVSTGAQVMVPAEIARPDPDGRIHTFCSGLEPKAGSPAWYQMGATLVAGMALRWLRDTMLDLRSGDAYERMTALAEHSPPGARGLLFLPFMVGERTPHMDARLRAAFLGLGANHDRGDLVRSVMEGTMLAARTAYDVLTAAGASPQRIIIAGGGARSPLWRQIAADIFDLPVTMLASADQAAMGAAMLAAAGVTGADPVVTAREWARYGAVTQPVPETAARYRELAGIYADAHVATAEISHRLVNFAEPRRDPIHVHRPSREG